MRCMFVTDLPRPATGPATALDAFRSIGWLAAVAPSTIERLAAQAMVMRMPRGTQIFDQAEIPTFAQFLLAGSIELLAVRGEEERWSSCCDPWTHNCPPRCSALCPIWCGRACATTP